MTDTDWPYHPNRNTGILTKCASNPCSRHSEGEDIYADSIEKAYEKLHERDSAQGLSTGIGIDEAEENCDNLNSFVMDMGLANAHVDSSNLHEGQSAMQLADGSYVSIEDLRSKLSSDELNRLVITSNDYDTDEELAKHWNDEQWLGDHAGRALARRATEPSDYIGGMLPKRVPSPRQWSEETGRPEGEYPAMSTAEGGDRARFYCRGARSMARRAAAASYDLRREASLIISDGFNKRTEQKVNMLAWSDDDDVVRAVLFSPHINQNRYDDDTLDHLMVKHSADNSFILENTTRSIQDDDIVSSASIDKMNTRDGVTFTNHATRRNIHFSVGAVKGGTAVSWVVRDDETDDVLSSGQSTSNGLTRTRHDMISDMRNAINAEY